MKFKRALIALVFLIAAGQISATSYHWNCGTFIIDATDTLIYCPQISTSYIYCTITNTGTADIYVRQIINSANLPSGWSFNMCNPNACWGPNVLVDTFLVAGSSSVIARFDFHTDNTIGNGVANVRFDDSAAPLADGATFNLYAFSQSTGIDELQNESPLLLYPNPAANQFTIYNLQFTIKELEIFNSLGEKVLQSKISNLKSQISLDVSQLLSGIYFVKVQAGKDEWIGKFVKE